MKITEKGGGHLIEFEYITKVKVTIWYLEILNILFRANYNKNEELKQSKMQQNMRALFLTWLWSSNSTWIGIHHWKGSTNFIKKSKFDSPLKKKKKEWFYSGFSFAENQIWIEIQAKLETQHFVKPSLKLSGYIGLGGLIKYDRESKRLKKKDRTYSTVGVVRRLLFNPW